MRLFILLWAAFLAVGVTGRAAPAASSAAPVIQVVRVLEPAEQNDLVRRLQQVERRFSFPVIFLASRSTPDQSLPSQSVKVAGRWLAQASRGAVVYYDAETETFGLGATVPPELIGKVARGKLKHELAALGEDGVAENARRAIYLVTSTALELPRSEPLNQIPLEQVAPSEQAAVTGPPPAARPPSAVPGRSPSTLSKAMTKLRPFGNYLVAGFALGVCLLVIWCFLRLEHGTDRRFTFPEPDIRPRFGGGVTGGHGASVPYTAKNSPPGPPTAA